MSSRSSGSSPAPHSGEHCIISVRSLFKYVPLASAHRRERCDGTLAPAAPKANMGTKWNLGGTRVGAVQDDPDRARAGGRHIRDPQSAREAQRDEPAIASRDV